MDLRSRKYKQYICENSHELREFERKLQTAYNRKVLEAQLALQKTEKIRDQITEKEISRIELEERAREEERLQQEREKQRRNKEQTARVLQKQIEVKKKNEELEFSNQQHERTLLEEELKQENDKKTRMITEILIAKEKRRLEQQRLIDLQKSIMEENKREDAEQEAKIRKEAGQLANFDHALIEERRKRIQQFDTIKEALARQLTEIQNLKQEKEEIRLRLACIEKEEQENRQDHERNREKVYPRQSLEEITQEKRLEMLRQREQDTQYANKIKQLLEIEEERERHIKYENRRVRTAIRTENSKLAVYRKDLRTAELEVEKANALLEIAEREERDKIVREERLKLLQSLDADLIDFLPAGILTEEDLLCLKR